MTARRVLATQEAADLEWSQLPTDVQNHILKAALAAMIIAVWMLPATSGWRAMLSRAAAANLLMP